MVFIYTCELVYPHYSGITSETEIIVLGLEVGNIKTNLHWKKISYLIIVSKPNTVTIHYNLFNKGIIFIHADKYITCTLYISTNQAKHTHSFYYCLYYSRYCLYYSSYCLYYLSCKVRVQCRSQATLKSQNCRE